MLSQTTDAGFVQAKHPLIVDGQTLAEMGKLLSSFHQQAMNPGFDMKAVCFILLAKISEKPQCIKALLWHTVQKPELYEDLQKIEFYFTIAESMIHVVK